MYVVKVLLAHTLRTGNVYGQTIEEVMRHTMKQPHHVVAWRYPTRPLLRRTSIKRVTLSVDEPYKANKVSTTVKSIARGLPNGPAGDMAYLKRHPEVQTLMGLGLFLVMIRLYPGRGFPEVYWTYAI